MDELNIGKFDAFNDFKVENNVYTFIKRDIFGEIVDKKIFNKFEIKNLIYFPYHFFNFDCGEAVRTKRFEKSPVIYLNK